MAENYLVSVKLKNAKQRLMDLWDSKGETDQEVLEAAEEVDKLLNEYDRANPAEISYSNLVNLTNRRIS